MAYKNSAIQYPERKGNSDTISKINFRLIHAFFVDPNNLEEEIMNLHIDDETAFSFSQWDAFNYGLQSFCTTETGYAVLQESKEEIQRKNLILLFGIEVDNDYQFDKIGDTLLMLNGPVRQPPLTRGEYIYFVPCTSSNFEEDEKGFLSGSIKLLQPIPDELISLLQKVGNRLEDEFLAVKRIPIYIGETWEKAEAGEEYARQNDGGSESLTFTTQEVNN